MRGSGRENRRVRIGAWRVYPKLQAPVYDTSCAGKRCSECGCTPKPRRRGSRYSLGALSWDTTRSSLGTKKTFIVRNQNGEEREAPSTKLVIGNIPKSFSNDEIVNRKLHGEGGSKKRMEADGREGQGWQWETNHMEDRALIPVHGRPSTALTKSCHHRDQSSRHPTKSKRHQFALSAWPKDTTDSSACTALIKCRQLPGWS